MQTRDTSMADKPPYPGTPRWVKVSGVILAILALLVVVLLFAGGGRHGPFRHLPPTGAAGGAPASSVAD